MFLIPVSPPQRRSDAEKWEENRTPLAENTMKKLAERVGVRARVLSKSHEYAGFSRKPQNRNDLPFANLYPRLRLFSSVCRFSESNDSRNDTRRDALGECLPRDSRASATAAIFLEGFTSSLNPSALHRTDHLLNADG